MEASYGEYSGFSWIAVGSSNIHINWTKARLLKPY